MIKVQIISVVIETERISLGRKSTEIHGQLAVRAKLRGENFNGEVEIYLTLEEHAQITHLFRQIEQRIARELHGERAS